MRTYTAAIVQMNSTPDLSENLKQAEVLVKKAVDERARLVVLPECFAYRSTLMRIKASLTVGQSEKLP